MKEYYLHDGTEKSGPFSSEELKGIHLSTLFYVWCEGMDDWKNITAIDELNHLLLKVSPPEFKMKDRKPPAFKGISNPVPPIYKPSLRNALPPDEVNETIFPPPIMKKQEESNYSATAIPPIPSKDTSAKVNKEDENIDNVMDSLKKVPIIQETRDVRSISDKPPQIPLKSTFKSSASSQINPTSSATIGSSKFNSENHSNLPNANRTRNIVLYILGGIIGVIFFFGHDLFQEFRTVYRDTGSTSSTIDQVQVEESKPNYSNESSLNTTASTSDNNNLNEQAASVENRYWWSCNKCGGIVKMEDKPNIDGCPTPDINDGSKYHRWSRLGQVGEINYSCNKCGAIIQVSSSPSVDGCATADLNDGSHYHRWSRL